MTELVELFELSLTVLVTGAVTLPLLFAWLLLVLVVDVFAWLLLVLVVDVFAWLLLVLVVDVFAWLLSVLTTVLVFVVVVKLCVFE